MSGASRIAVVAAKGRIRAIVERLGTDGWFGVDEVASEREVTESHFALVRSIDHGEANLTYTPADALWPQSMPENGLRKVPIIGASIYGQRRRKSVRTEEIFFLGNSRERLAFLAALARCRRTANGERRTANGERRIFLAGVHAQTRDVQLQFDLHLTERALAKRLGVSTSSIRRWFSMEGAIAPKRLMQWIQMQEIAVQIAVYSRTLEYAGAELHFEYPEAIRRTMRHLLGRSPKSLRTQTGYTYFLERMGDACGYCDTLMVSG